MVSPRRIDRRATSGTPRRAHPRPMPEKGTKEPGHDSLATLDTAAEVNERDYKEGQLRKAGQRSSRPGGDPAGASEPSSE